MSDPSWPTMWVDMYRFGNVARFVKPLAGQSPANLVAVNVMVDSDRPSVGLFAARSIETHEELTCNWNVVD